MGEYDDGPRRLPWPLLNPLVGSRQVEDDEDFPPSSFVWPEDPDERTMIPFWLSLNEYNVLGSTIDVGSDPAFGIDALRVMWLWMRNWRIQVPICDAVNDCITNNPTTITNIVNQLMISTTFNDYITNLILTVSPGGGGNVYPPRPTVATPDPLCNAANYLADQLKVLFQEVYDDLETLTPDEVLAALLGVLGWRSSPLYSLIGLLETNDKNALLDAFEIARPGLICALLDAELDQTPVVAWINTTYPSPSVIGDAMKLAVQSAADEGKWAQWIAVGALKTGSDCDDCAPEVCDNFATGNADGWVQIVANYATITPTGWKPYNPAKGRFGIKNNTITPTGKTLTITFNEPTSGFVRVRNYAYSGGITTERTFTNAIEYVIPNLPANVGIAVDFGRDYGNENIPFPLTMRLTGLCVE